MKCDHPNLHESYSIHPDLGTLECKSCGKIWIKVWK